MGRSAKLKAARRAHRAAVHLEYLEQLAMTRAEVKAMAQDTSRITPQGQQLGADLVALVEPAIASLAADGEPDTRCASCAFRAGTVPNGCPVTVLDAFKATMEGQPFLCHLQLGNRGTCHGWYAGQVALRAKGIETQHVPYQYSHEWIEKER